MTLKRAHLFFWACVLFAAGTGLFAYLQVDWASVRIGGASGNTVSGLPAIVDVDVEATVTALAGRTGSPVSPAATARTRTVVTPTAPPLAGGGVTIEGVLYRVNAVADPEAVGFFRPPAGSHLVAVNVTIRAAATPVSYGFAQFRMADSGGREFGWALGNSEPKLDQGVLTPGSTRTGWIAFSLPDGAKPAVISVQPIAGGPRTPIAAIP